MGIQGLPSHDDDDDDDVKAAVLGSAPRSFWWRPRGVVLLLYTNWDRTPSGLKRAAWV